jgi:cell filamentation protein
MAGTADPRADYDVFDDPYCYKGTNVLKNIPGLRDPAALAAFETVSVAQRADEPLPGGRLSAAHYRAIHRHLFQDVFRWAGRLRRVRISKAGSMFCYPENIAAEMNKLFLALKQHRYLRGLTTDDFAAQAAHFLAELNAIHPFREGNGRAQMTFMALVARQAGHPFDLERLDPDQFLAAIIRSFSEDEAPLTRQIRGLLP